ncbi:MAG: phosphatidylcholine/phosphatidylserine synthase [Paracoccaceae bacterium]
MTIPAPRPRKKLHLVQLLPNFLTLSALCAGLTAMRFAMQGHVQWAVALIILAAVLDGLDGRLARMLSSESEIGAELDSLADFLNFGVAPGFILFYWTLNANSGVGWIAVLIYAICCALRLARFNVGNRPTAEPQEKRFFRGVPSPAGALLALMPMYFAFMLPQSPILPSPLVALWMVAVGVLMISRMPTWSFKSTTVYAEHAKFIMVGFVALAGALLTYPWATLFLMGLGYLVSLVVAGRQLRKTPPAAEE